jgi:hypothetical protein
MVCGEACWHEQVVCVRFNIKDLPFVYIKYGLIVKVRSVKKYGYVEGEYFHVHVLGIRLKNAYGIR